MKNTFKKIVVIMLSLLLIVAALPFSVMATDAIDVELNGLNVTATEGTIGTGVVKVGEDYVTVLTASEGFEITLVEVYSPYYEATHLDFDFNYETGVLTVPTNGFSDAAGLVINVTTGRVFNYETDVIDATELPYSDSFALDESNIIKDFGLAAKVFKVELAEGETLDIKFVGDYTDTELDIGIGDAKVSIYTYDEECGLECIESFYQHCGIECVFEPEEPGTYYVVTMCYNEYIGDVYSLELSIYEEPNNEEEPTPTPGTGTGSGSIAGGSDDIIIDVIIPDLETPDIPNTSVESNATALAVLSLTVGGALLLTFKRKEK